MSGDWPRPLVHVQVTAQDPDRLAAFYAALFSWPGDGTPVAGVGGPEPGPALQVAPGRHPGVSLYVQVRDVSATLARVEGLGGRVLTPLTHVPGGPSVGALLDPEGNRFVLVQQ